MVNPYRFYTYAYLREDKTPYYIGKGKGNRAFIKNRRGAKPPKNRTRILFLKKNLTEEEAFRHEKYMIAVFGRKDLGTGILINKTNGGEGIIGYSHTEKTKNKMSEMMKSKIISEETKIKMSQSQKGRTISKEHRLKISKALKGKNLKEETKRKLSEAHSGKILSEEHKKKLREVQSKKRWWTDGCGNSVFAVDCPYNNWYNGRGKLNRKSK
jgi:hypothetical protein